MADSLTRRVALVALLAAWMPAVALAEGNAWLIGDGIDVTMMNSGPTPPPGIEPGIAGALPPTAVVLDEVPTSSWTYGCTATSAGMLFGYYDRTDFPNMYTGPANGGVCPPSDLGNQCSIIATQNGFDGRSTPGHVDDYWISYGNSGPDPWELGGTEHTWGGCTADYMGTNQWKWDFDDGTGEYGTDGVTDANVDGSTIVFSYNSASRLYDYVPPAQHGTPQTACCHGLRLFAESRGYEVAENYTQKTEEEAPGGFSFDDYIAEIDAGRPVLIQVASAIEGHTMVGVGYNADDQTVYLHTTWGDYIDEMTWGGTFSGMDHYAVTVIHLVPEPATVVLIASGGVMMLVLRRRRRT